MIYLDHNATTPVAPEVFEAMAPYLTAEWGNPSSSYRFGARLKAPLERAREQTAELIGAYAGEIVFTSCATESNNAAIHAALKAAPKRRHVVTTAVEHSSVLNYCRALDTEGYRVTYLPVDRDGLLKIGGHNSLLSLLDGVILRELFRCAVSAASAIRLGTARLVRAPSFSRRKSKWRAQAWRSRTTNLGIIPVFRQRVDPRRL